MKIHTLSASKIKAWKMCQFKFYLEYYLHLSTGTSFAAEQGSMVHVIFERMGDDLKNGVKKDDSYIFNNWGNEILYAYQEEGLWKLSEKAIEREKECRGCPYNRDGLCFIANAPIDKLVGCPKTEYEDAIWLVERLLNDPRPSNPLNRKILEVEQRFEHKVQDGSSEIQINGYIDVVTELDKQTIEIEDYKTGNYTQSYNACSKDPQLLIYHLAIKDLWRGYNNFLITINYLRKKPITLAFSEKDEIGTENAIRHYWHMINSTDSPRRRCDKGRQEQFDHVCKYMCDIKLCKKQYKLFQENSFNILPAPENPPQQRKTWLKRLKDNK